MRNKLSVRNALTIVTGILVLQGCITKSVYEGETFREKFSAVLMTEDGGEIVVIGNRYHYIFAPPDVVKATLTESFKDHVEMATWKFEINRSGKVRGKIRLQLANDASDAEKAAALQAGYVQPDGLYSYYAAVETHMEGKAYRPTDLELSESIKLNKTYEVGVYESMPYAELAARLPLSPITLAADGALVIAGTAAALVAIPVLMWVYALEG